MIKVNLLATNPGAAPEREWLPREQRSALVGLGVLVVTALGLGGLWYYQRSQAVAIQTRIAAAETELVRLKDAAKLVDAMTARRAELAERLALIDRLRTEKRGPVSLLETVSRSVPEGLWLVEIKQAGPTVQVDGRATTLTAVTDFAGRMQTSGLFKHPVEIVTTTTEVIEETTVIRFTIKAEALPASEVPAPTAPPSATALATAVPANSGV